MLINPRPRERCQTRPPWPLAIRYRGVGSPNIVFLFGLHYDCAASVEPAQKKRPPTDLTAVGGSSDRWGRRYWRHQCRSRYRRLRLRDCACWPYLTGSKWSVGSFVVALVTEESESISCVEGAEGLCFLVCRRRRLRVVSVHGRSQVSPSGENPRLRMRGIMWPYDTRPNRPRR